jgi:hypothetical protein
MPFPFVNSGATSNNGSGGTLGVAVSGVHVGDLVYAVASASGIGAITCSDGTTTLTPGTQISTGNSGNTQRPFWLVASVASGNPTYTATFTGTPTSRSIQVQVFTPSAAAAFDKQNGTETVATTAGASGNVGPTTIADQLCFGAQVNENQSASSVEKINGVAATAVLNSGTNATLWYTTPSATFTGQATETIGSSTRTLTSLVTFGISAAGRSFLLGRH